MEGLTLVIKGWTYNSSNLHLLPDDINGYCGTSRIDENEKVIGFFGELNPLSNFHPTKFTINGITYHSSEQFIQHQKSVIFGDRSAEMMILMDETPLECKAVSRNITNFNPSTWKDNAKATCIPGILAKFEQHPWLSKLLTRTNGYTLVECCNDKDWGTGVPLYVPDALKCHEWQSQGLLSKILETVCTIMNPGIHETITKMDTTFLPLASHLPVDSTRHPTSWVPCT